MGQLSRKLRSIEKGGLGFFCPGCREMHVIYVGDGPGPRWGWNGDAERPVFTPSVRVGGLETLRDSDGRWTGAYVRDEAGNPVAKVCHSFIGCNGAQPGQIIFCTDSTHELSGKVVDLPDLPDLRIVDDEERPA